MARLRHEAAAAAGARCSASSCSASPSGSAWSARSTSRRSTVACGGNVDHVRARPTSRSPRSASSASPRLLGRRSLPAPRAGDHGRRRGLRRLAADLVRGVRRHRRSSAPSKLLEYGVLGLGAVLFVTRRGRLWSSSRCSCSSTRAGRRLRRSTASSSTRVAPGVVPRRARPRRAVDDVARRSRSPRCTRRPPSAGCRSLAGIVGRARHHPRRRARRACSGSTSAVAAIVALAALRRLGHASRALRRRRS